MKSLVAGNTAHEVEDFVQLTNDSAVAIVGDIGVEVHLTPDGEWVGVYEGIGCSVVEASATPEPTPEPTQTLEPEWEPDDDDYDKEDELECEPPDEPEPEPVASLAEAPVEEHTVPFRDTHLIGHCSMGAWSPRKSDKGLSVSVVNDTNAESGRVRVWKSLFGPHSDIHKITALQQQLGNSIRAVSSPWGDTGDRLIPAEHIDALDALVDKAKAEMDRLVANVVERWDELVEAERDRLKGAYNPDDYPAKDVVAGKFWIRWDYWMVPSDGNAVVKGLDDYAERLRENEKSRISYQKEVIKRDIASKLAKPLANVVERLRKDRTKIHASLLGNIAEIIRVASAMNVYNDAWIASLEADVQLLLRNDVQGLREDKAVRQRVADTAARILETYINKEL